MSAAFTDDDVQAALTAAANRDLCEHELALATNEKPVPSWVCEPCEMRAVLDAVAPAIAARAVREAAEQAIAEAVCCDEYERFKATGERPKHPHHICYWGAAHAEALRTRADEIERTH
jgi:hypothetical protein